MEQVYLTEITIKQIRHLNLISRNNYTRVETKSGLNH